MTEPNMVMKKITELIEISDIMAFLERLSHVGIEKKAMKLRYEM